VLRDWFVAIIS